MPNKGEADVKFVAEVNQVRQITFQNADVGMPIVSTNKLAHEDNDITYRKDDGYITNTVTEAKTPFIARDGVYFIKMKVPKNAMTARSPDLPFQEGSQA